MDLRLLEAFRRQRASFDKAAALMEPPGEQLTIGFEGAEMPAYLFRAPGVIAPRPLLIATSGYDTTIYEGFVGSAVPALVSARARRPLLGGRAAATLGCG